MKTKEKILYQYMEKLDVDKLVILEALIDIRDTMVEIEKRLNEIGGQIEYIAEKIKK